VRRTKCPVEVMHRSQQLPEPLQRTGETSTQIERTQRRRIQKGERGHHPGRKGRSEGKRVTRRNTARKGWNYTRVRFDLRRVVQSIALQLRPGTGGISLARFSLYRVFR